MKIGLYRNMVGTLPKEFKNELSKLPLLTHRIKLGEFIVNNGKELGHFGDGGTMYEYNKQFYYIFDVNTNRPWTIQDYDGIEYIKYLDYIVQDKELNYCTYID